MSETIEGLIEKYRLWAANNPSLIQDVEIFLRGFSYFLSGYIKEIVISEFVYSLAQLISVLHSRIIKRNAAVSPSVVSLLEDLLRVLKCVEVFLEIAALRLGGPKARWIVLISLQLVKGCMKLVILKKTGRILKPLDQERKNNDLQKVGGQYYTLPCSGRRIRTLQAGPPMYERTWQPPGPMNSNSLHLTTMQYSGEILYILKPVLHLAAVGKCGEQAWAPFLLAMSLDFASQVALGSKNQSREHREEVLRRWFSLANYCLRSPFYDRKSKYVILGFLRCVEKCLPLGGGLVASIREYIPEYVKIYSYVWAD
eukprot:TRINITY_DN2029_c0_g1_i10.p1 TRINITY_DN2029_c0_g1~~TRINITY_DN2029_c0_g1_i10.p1  ORF type:complete len:312 (-),score=39.35 TRINITY_DN2029_c0_g1_i10:424-1359(-)